MSEKVNNSERERLDELQKKVNDKVLAYGRQQYIVEDLREQLEAEKEQAEEMREEISELQEDYESYVQKLYQKYGDVVIDLDTGDIIEQE